MVLSEAGSVKPRRSALTATLVSDGNTDTIGRGCAKPGSLPLAQASSASCNGMASTTRKRNGRASKRPPRASVADLHADVQWVMIRERIGEVVEDPRGFGGQACATSALQEHAIEALGAASPAYVRIG